MFETAIVTLIIKLCRVSESFDVVENSMTASVLGEKSVSRKMHNFLPGRPSLLHVTIWKFCTISKYFLHTINSHQDVSLGWYKILSDNYLTITLSSSECYSSLLMHFHAQKKKTTFKQRTIFNH